MIDALQNQADNIKPNQDSVNDYVPDVSINQEDGQDIYSLLDKMRDKRIAVIKRNRTLESQIAILKANKEAKRKDIFNLTFNHKDMIFEDFIPNLSKNEFFRFNRSSHPEVSKMMNSNLPQPGDFRYGIEDQDGEQFYDFH